MRDNMPNIIEILIPQIFTLALFGVGGFVVYNCFWLFTLLTGELIKDLL
jgi:hypothetical protein